MTPNLTPNGSVAGLQHRPWKSHICLTPWAGWVWPPDTLAVFLAGVLKGGQSHLSSKLQPGCSGSGSEVQNQTGFSKGASVSCLFATQTYPQPQQDHQLQAAQGALVLLSPLTGFSALCLHILPCHFDLCLPTQPWPDKIIFFHLISRNGKH